MSTLTMKSQEVIDYINTAVGDRRAIENISTSSSEGGEVYKVEVEFTKKTLALSEEDETASDQLSQFIDQEILPKK